MCWRRSTYIQTNECGKYMEYVGADAAATVTAAVAAVPTIVGIFTVSFASTSVPSAAIAVARIQSAQMIRNCTVFPDIVVLIIL